LVHDREAVRLGSVRAEVHGAEAEPADRKPAASQMRIVHSGVPLGGIAEPGVFFPDEPVYQTLRASAI
jgi:hypothetical protein